MHKLIYFDRLITSLLLNKLYSSLSLTVEYIIIRDLRQTLFWYVFRIQNVRKLWKYNCFLVINKILIFWCFAILLLDIFFCYSKNCLKSIQWYNLLHNLPQPQKKAIKNGIISLSTQLIDSTYRLNTLLRQKKSIDTTYYRRLCYIEPIFTKRK